MKAIWGVAAIMLPLTCSAGDWASIHIGSSHSKATYFDDSGDIHEYNETNLGLGVMSSTDKYTELGAGYYRNSFNRNSFYAGADFHTSDDNAVRAGVSFFAVTGYEESYVMPLPNITARINSQIRVSVGYLPAKDNDGADVITLTLGVAFK